MSDLQPLPYDVTHLLDLAHRARHAAQAAELRFMAVNDSHALAPYRQAALWLRNGGVSSLSGVIQVEANLPFVLWLNSACSHLATQQTKPCACDARDLPAALAEDWAEWLPAHGLWLPFGKPDDLAGGLLLARDASWNEAEITWLSEWMDIWHHAWCCLYRPPRLTWTAARQAVRNFLDRPEDTRWWQWRSVRWGAAIVAILLFPVRLSVLAPGELVAAHPTIIRAPLDGVIEAFHVQPNQTVKHGQALFGFDEALIRARLEVARQALATAEAEYRQTTQLALADARSKPQLALLTGKIEEKRAEVTYIADQLARADVVALQDGIALFDDPAEWIGRPVNVGERIMRIATPGDVEIEAWVPLADAIPLPTEANASLYLSATPLSPIDAKVRYLAHDAVERPDGTFAYRLRAKLETPTEHRVGLKGTVRLSGERVPLIYWMLRRPLAGIRATLGW